MFLGLKNFLLLATKTELRRISFDTPDYTAVVLPLTGLKHSMAVDFDPVDKHVYWSDDTFDTINRARLDGTGIQDLFFFILGDFVNDSK